LEKVAFVSVNGAPRVHETLLSAVAMVAFGLGDGEYRRFWLLVRSVILCFRGALIFNVGERSQPTLEALQRY